MSNQTYAVTGVASVIGAALAKILREQGHRVIGFDIQDATDTVDQFIFLDLNDPDSITSAAAQISTPIDGLCNNAGLPPRAGLEAANLQVNFIGTRAFTNAMLDHLTDGASIVNMASRAGHGWHQGLDQVKRLAALTGPDQLTAFITDEGSYATRC